MPRPPDYEASRAFGKLAAALDAFSVDPRDAVCADFGCHAGGFTDCLLQRGAARVYAVDRGYGVLDLRLRRDPRVSVRERTDAMRVFLPEAVDGVTIDVGWTRQQYILPAARRLLKASVPGAWIISLIKPHYEAEPARLQSGVLPPEHHPPLLESLRAAIPPLGLRLDGEVASPVPGHGGNHEYLWLLRPV